MECSISEYYEALKAHDWFFEWSDDHGVYTRGREENKRLEAIAKEKGGGYQALWDGFIAHHFSGPAFNSDPKPMPRLNEYL